MAQFELTRDHLGNIAFSGSLTIHDLAEVRLDEVERRAIETPARNNADHLLDLEIIFRRLDEQQAHD